MKELFNFVYIECDPPANNPGMRISQFKTKKQKDDCLNERTLLLDAANFSSKSIQKDQTPPFNGMVKYQQINHITERKLFNLYFQVNRN